MKRTRRAALAVALAATVALFAPFVSYAHAVENIQHAKHSQHRPTDRPKRVARVADWNLANADYWWLSSHEVLFLRGAWKKGWTYYRADLRSAKVEPLPDISSLVRRCYGNAQSVSVSPNRKTLLLDCMKSNVRAVDIRAHPRFPDHQAYPEEGPYASIAYMGADSRWVEALFPYPVGNGEMSGLVLHDGKHQKVIRTATFRPPLNMPDGATLTPRNHFVFAARGHTPLQPAPRIMVTHVDLNVSNPIARTHNISLPKTMFNISEIVTSPRGDRVAWLVEPQPVTLVNGKPVLKSERRFEIWASGVHGERMRKVGSALYRWTKLAPQGRLAPRWLPDGRAISCVEGGFLWTTPAF